jgi:hypothetical protein
LPGHATISANIRTDLCNPVLGIGAAFKQRKPVRPSAAMPEVAIAKHCKLLSDENDIGASWEAFDMLPIPKAQTPKLLPQDEFRFRVGSLDFLLGT